MDWSATMIAAAGAKPDSAYPLDGDDLRSVIGSKRAKYDRTFFWRTYRQAGMRSGNWKYVREENKEYLHDLSVDEREQANFADAEPIKLADMRMQFEKWASGMQNYPKK